MLGGLQGTVLGLAARFEGARVVGVGVEHCIRLEGTQVGPETGSRAQTVVLGHPDPGIIHTEGIGDGVVVRGILKAELTLQNRLDGPLFEPAVDDPGYRTGRWPGELHQGGRCAAGQDRVDRQGARCVAVEAIDAIIDGDAFTVTGDCERRWVWRGFGRYRYQPVDVAAFLLQG